MVCERWSDKDGVCKMVCDKVVCERWCATTGVTTASGREAGGEAPGIQNQKQEPHTKLWGKI